VSRAAPPATKTSATGLSDRETTAVAPGRGRLAPALAVGALCLAVVLVLNALLVHQVGVSGDEPYYARMANHPGGPHNFPYAFRVGVPYLVHILPFSHAFSWRLVAYLATAVAAAALFALLRDFDVGPRLATGLAVGFSVSPPLLVVFLRNGISVDPASVMVITLGCLFIVRRRLLALAVTLLIGTTVHESCLFLIPLAYAVWAQRLIDLRALRDLCRVALVPVALYVYLRSSIVAVGEAYQPGYVGPFFTERADVVKLALGSGGWRRELRRLALDYGPLWLAAPFALPRLPFARRGLVLVALCVGSMTFALDWGRAAFFAAPVIYVAAGWVLRDRRRLALLAVLALLAMDGGYAVYMQVHGVRHGLDTTAPPDRGPVR
jgi:hypothetical protein